MDDHTHFTKEALKAQDGKKVPLTRELGGPVIGEATLRYDPGVGVIADIQIDETQIERIFTDSDQASAVIFREES
jgi:hypothetical protein